MQRPLSVVLALVATAALAQEIPVSDAVFVPASSASSIVASGDTFITVWTPFANGMYATVTGLDGTLRRDTTTISTTGSGKAIAGGPRGALVAWIENGLGFTALFDRGGNVINRTPLGAMSGSFFTGAWNGNEFFLLVGGFDDITGYRFDRDGKLLGDPLTVGKNVGTKFVSADPGGFVVFVRKISDRTIWARRIESSGAMEPWTATATGVPDFSNVAPYFDGAHHVVFWAYQGSVHRVVADALGAPVAPQSDLAVSANGLIEALPAGANTLLRFSQLLALVSPDGTVLASSTPPQQAVDMAAIGTRVLLVESSGAGHFVDGVTAGEPFELAHAAAAQTFPQVAGNDKLLLAVWSEDSGLYFARIDPVTHRHLDGRGIQLAARGGSAAVTALGDDFLVAYNDDGKLRLRRIASDGTMLDPAPIVIATAGQRPRLASDGSSALLVWSDETSRLRGTRIAASGAILDPAFLRISDADDAPLHVLPDVAFNGENFLVVWQREQPQLHGRQIGVSAVRVAPDGAILDLPIRLPLQSDASVAANGSTFGVIGRALNGVDLALVTIDAAGTAGAAVLAGRGSAPVAGPRGSGFFVAASSLFGLRAPQLSPTPFGLAFAYTRAGDEYAFGGSQRAYVRLLGDARLRAASR